jgi:hypothetical protein
MKLINFANGQFIDDINKLLEGVLSMARHPKQDIVASGVNGTTAVLAMGRVSERVVARGGRPAVRLMATLCCTGDHKVWDGQRVGKLLGEIARILETDELAKEVPVHEVEAATHVALDSAG